MTGVGTAPIELGFARFRMSASWRADDDTLRGESRRDRIAVGARVSLRLPDSADSFACVLFSGIAVLSEDRFVIIRVGLWVANAIAAPLAWLYWRKPS
ncbi:MAG: hypothetical protein D8M53_08710 [Armatimonadetes bacterium]|nr:hypothetical protein [Armatimonadota bacterium]